MTTTRTLSSSPSAVSVLSNSSSVCELIAFSTAGRLIVTRATAPSRSTRRVVGNAGSRAVMAAQSAILKYTPWLRGTGWRRTEFTAFTRSNRAETSGRRALDRSHRSSAVKTVTCSPLRLQPRSSTATLPRRRLMIVVSSKMAATPTAAPRQSATRSRTSGERSGVKAWCTSSNAP